MNKLKIVLLVLVLGFSTVVYFVVKPYYLFLINTVQISPLKALFSNNSVKKIDDTVNILILGIAGGNHEGPNLSDSIIVLHYNFKTNRMLTIGIPRDIWSDTLKDKINTAYAYGEAKQEDGGLKLAKAEVSAITGMPIQYSMVISFSKFRDLIDFLGGVTVNVEKSFTDSEFPIEGKENDLCDGDTKYRCRYETITFHKGKTRMDGTTALKFVRSRHAEGEEGSDFARSKRQQMVISAIKEKIVEIVMSLDLETLKNLYAKTDALVNRDVTNQQLMTIVRDIVLSKNFVQKNLFLPEDLFIVPEYSKYEGKYVLIPQTDWNEIYTFTQCLLEKQAESECLPLVDQGKEDH